MSQALFNQVKHLSDQLQALQHAYVELSERVLTLEAERAEQSTELDIDTLAPKKRGRPARVQA